MKEPASVSAFSTSSTPVEVAPQAFPEPTFTATPNALDASAVTATPAPSTYRVIGIPRGDYLNVREGAGSNYPVVATLEPGTDGIVLGTKRAANGETTWQEIFVGGHGGWVNADYIALGNPSAGVSDTLAGTPPLGRAITGNSIFPDRITARSFCYRPRLWLIFFLCWMRSRLRGKSASPGIAYLTVTALALMVITLTGHLGGILSGVETP